MNEFEQLVKYILDKPLYVILFFVFLGIINLSNLISAYKNIKSFLVDTLKKKENHTFIFDGEVTSYEILLSSKKFDVVKINAINHFFGVGSEYEWLKKYYKNAKGISQRLTEVEIGDGKNAYFDVQTIIFGNQQKKIYFDISSFLNEYGNSETEGDSFIKHKIKELYK